MATRVADEEGWERLTKAELSSTDPRVVSRILNLLRACQGLEGQNREGPLQRKALAKIRDLTLDFILNRCSLWLHLPRDYPDVTALADRIFASHAVGEPFIGNGPYRTWLDIWRPERGSFAGLLMMTATSRCQDWLRLLGRDPHAKHFKSLDLLESRGEQPVREEATRPDLEFEAAEVARVLSTTIDLLLPGKATDAIRARVCRGMSAPEYAAESGIDEKSAHMQMARGAEALAKRLVQDGHVAEGFGRNLISVGKLTRKVLSTLRPGYGLADFWKDR